MSKESMFFKWTLDVYFFWFVIDLKMCFSLGFGAVPKMVSGTPFLSGTVSGTHLAQPFSRQAPLPAAAAAAWLCQAGLAGRQQEGMTEDQEPRTTE